MDNQFYFFLQSQSLLLEQILKNKKGPGTTYHLLLSLQNKFRDIPLLAVYYLTKLDDVMKKVFFVCYSKNCIH